MVDTVKEVKSKGFSEQEWTSRVEASCEKRDYKFLGFADKFRSGSSKIVLECIKHGAWRTTTASNFVNLGHGCPSCARMSTASYHTKTDEEMIESFMKSGKFKIGTLFWRSPKLTVQNRASFWHMRCPVCSEDEYVKAGLCTGIFESTCGDLQHGYVPCRCASTFRWTRSQREHQVNKILNSNGNTVEFLGWQTSYKNNKSRLILHCKEHEGSWDTSLDSLLYGSGCPTCAKTGFDPSKTGYVYVLKAVGANNFVGFGITSYLEDRMRIHKRNIEKSNSTVLLSEAFSMAGNIALEIENSIKARFPLHRQEIDGFRREATHIHLYEDVVKFVENAVLTLVH